MIIERVGRGLIYAGKTNMASSFIVEETGPLEITVRAGSYTSTGDAKAGILPRTYTMASDAICTVFNTAPAYKLYQGQLIASQWSTDILWISYYANQEYPPMPDGFELVQNIVWQFYVPPNVTSLENTEICVLKVMPGFPDGIDGDNWDGMQTMTGVL